MRRPWDVVDSVAGWPRSLRKVTYIMVCDNCMFIITLFGNNNKIKKIHSVQYTSNTVGQQLKIRCNYADLVILHLTFLKENYLQITNKYVSHDCSYCEIAVRALRPKPVEVSCDALWVKCDRYPPISVERPTWAARPDAGANGKFNRLIYPHLRMFPPVSETRNTDLNADVWWWHRKCRDRVKREDYQLDLFGHYFGHGIPLAKR